MYKVLALTLVLLASAVNAQQVSVNPPHGKSGVVPTTPEYDLSNLPYSNLPAGSPYMPASPGNPAPPVPQAAQAAPVVQDKTWTSQVGSFSIRTGAETTVANFNSRFPGVEFGVVQGYVGSKLYHRVYSTSSCSQLGLSHPHCLPVFN